MRAPDPASPNPAHPPERDRVPMPLHRYLASVVLLALLPLAALVCWQMVRTVGADEAQMEGDLARAAAAFSGTVDGELLASVDALAALARSDTLRDRPTAAFEHLLRTRPPVRRDWAGVFLAQADGRLLLDTGPDRTSAAGSLPALSRQVVETGRPAVSDLVDASPTRPHLLVAVPVERDGRVTALLGARVSTAGLQRLAGAVSRPVGGSALLHDARGQIVASTRPGAAVAGLAAPVLSTRERPFGVDRTTGADGRPYYTAWQTVQAAPGWGVQVMVPAQPIVAAHRRVVLTALAASAASLLLGALLASVAARRVTRPLRVLAETGHSGLPGPVAVQEIALLRDALQAAAERDAQSRQALEDDIAQRRRIEDDLLGAQESLQEQQRLVELAQDAGRVGFCQYRYRTGELVWTPGHGKLFGRGQLASSGLAPWFDRIAVEDRERVRSSLAAACSERRDGLTVEYAALQPDGSTRWLSTRLRLAYDAAGSPLQLSGVSVDMTDQREAELQREELTRREVAARRDAEASSRAKDEFLAMLGHELRNPLGAISAATDVLEAAPPQSEGAQEARTIIGRQARNLAHLVHDLLDVGRVMSGQIVLERKPVNLAVVLSRVRGTSQVTGGSATHDLHLQADDVWVHGDAVRLEQVLSNLLGNALKYTPAGRRVDVGIGRVGHLAVVEVRDAGPGIAPELLARVFDLFVQGARPLDRRAGGLGIGLTLVRRVVELHGGSVEAASSSDGSCFTLRLPAIEPPDRPEGDSLPSRRRRRVLVIDDNADVLAALRSKLELDGHSVSTAIDGIDGLNRLLRQQPEVSIVDIGLPGLTGYDVARHARAAGYGGRLIALSGYGQERDRRDALVAGFDAYLVKPVERADLRASLNAT